MRIESGSSLGTFRTCPKKYSFTYEEKLDTPYYNQNLWYGNFVHAHRGMVHAQRIDIDAIAKAQKELDHIYDEARRLYPNDKDQIESEFALASEITRLWIDYWDGHTGSLGEHELKWVEVEEEWTFAVLGDPSYLHAGKRDGLILHKDFDKLFLYELKTATDRDNDNYIHRLQLDNQINSNIIALERQGAKIAGVIYDVIWKPGLKRKTNRKTMADETLKEFHTRIIEEVKASPSTYFTRVMVYRNQDHLQGYELELLEQYKNSNPERVRYRNPNACMNYGSLCPFFNLCMDPEQTEQRAVFRVREKRLPELNLGD